MDIKTPEEGSLDSSAQDKNADSRIATENSELVALIEGLKSELLSVKEQQQKQSQYVGKLEKLLKKPDEVKIEDKKVNPMQQQLDEVIKFKKLLEEKDNFVKEREKLTAIEEAIIRASGMDALAAKRYAKLLITENGNKIQVSEDNGNYQVGYYESEDTQPMTIDSFVSAHFQTEEGKMFLPSKVNPSSAKNANGFKSTSKPVYTKEDLQYGRIPGGLQAVSRGAVIIKD